ncbi:MAG: hypothetical protein AAF386_08095 [Pseudomonadota bacterium]
MRYIILFTLIGAVSACGSSRSSSGPSTSQVSVPFASGPIYNACLEADRRKASQRLCGCIQATANQDLSSREQSRAVGFFRDPHKAQEARGGSTFWTRYRAWSDRTKRVCARA